MTFKLDFSVLRNEKSISDYMRENQKAEQENELRTAQIEALNRKNLVDETGGDGGSTGQLISKYMTATGATFPEALQAVQTGMRQNMLYQDGRLAPIPGAPESKGDIKFGETLGGKKADLLMNSKITGAETDARNLSDLKYKPDINEATKKAEKRGEAEGDIEKRIVQATAIDGLVTEGEALLPKATSGGANTLARNTGAFFNHATEGSTYDSQLNIIAGNITSNIPRMEGPQSDRDTMQYRQMAGDLADSTKPREVRIAAAAALRKLNNKYLKPKLDTVIPGGEVVLHGATERTIVKILESPSTGKERIFYSDGTTEIKDANR